MAQLLKWRRSDEGYTRTHCGRWRISPLYMSCVKPQAFDLYHDGKKVGSMISTQRAAKERAQHMADEMELTAHIVSAGTRTPCLECGEPISGEPHDDPRDPPLDADACLCLGCAIDTIEEVIEDHEREIADLKRKLRALRPQKRDKHRRS